MSEERGEKIALQLSRYLVKVIGKRTRHKTDKSTISIRSFSCMPELYIKELVKKRTRGRERIKNTTAFGSICSTNYMNEENIENDFYFYA
jgi:hypothetical protein